MPGLDNIERFGAYLLLHRIAIGGMAEIFLALPAQQPHRDKLLVIKRIREDLSSDEDFVQMFIDEARLVSRLAHPNIIKLHEFGEVDGRYFIALEYVWGESLRTLTLLCNKKGLRFPTAAALFIGAGVAKALDHAHLQVDGQGHSAPVIHRDVTLGNVVVSYHGEIKVLDYGIAKAKGRLAHTRAGQIKGTLAYLAPEQLLGKKVGPKTDIYQLGVLLYQLIVGRVPIIADSEGAMMASIVSGQVTRPSDLLSQFPPLIEKVLLKALAKEPKKRFASAREFMKALAYVLKDTPYAQEGALRTAHMMHNIAGDRQQMQQGFIDGILAGVEVDERAKEMMRWASADDVPENLNVELSIVTTTAALDDFEDEATRVSVTIPELMAEMTGPALPLADAASDVPTRPVNVPSSVHDSVVTSISEIKKPNISEDQGRRLAGPQVTHGELFDDDVATINVSAQQAQKMIEEARRLHAAEVLKSDVQTKINGSLDDAPDPEDMFVDGDIEPSTFHDELPAFAPEPATHPIEVELPAGKNAMTQSMRPVSVDGSDSAATIKPLEAKQGMPSLVPPIPAPSPSTPQVMAPAPAPKSSPLRREEAQQFDGMEITSGVVEAYAHSSMQAEDFDHILGFSASRGFGASSENATLDDVPQALSEQVSGQNPQAARSELEPPELAAEVLAAQPFPAASAASSLSIDSMFQDLSGQFSMDGAQALIEQHPEADLLSQAAAQQADQDKSNHRLFFVFALVMGILLGLGAVTMVTVPGLLERVTNFIGLTQAGAAPVTPSPNPQAQNPAQGLGAQPQQVLPPARSKERSPDPQSQIEHNQQEPTPALSDSAQSAKPQAGQAAADPVLRPAKMQISVGQGYFLRHQGQRGAQLDVICKNQKGHWAIVDGRDKILVKIAYDVDDMGAVLNIGGKPAVDVWSGPVKLGLSPQTLGPSLSFDLKFARKTNAKAPKIELRVFVSPPVQP